jgi:hypothetical protein
MNICIYNGYYPEVFDLLFKIFKDFNYEQFELYNVKIDDNQLNNYIKKNPEKSTVKYIYTTGQHFFLYVINNQGFMVNKNKKIFECTDLDNCREILQDSNTNFIQGGRTRSKSKSNIRSKSRSRSRSKSRTKTKTPAIVMLVNNQKNKTKIINNLY